MKLYRNLIIVLSLSVANLFVSAFLAATAGPVVCTVMNVISLAIFVVVYRISTKQSATLFDNKKSRKITFYFLVIFGIWLSTFLLVINYGYPR